MKQLAAAVKFIIVLTGLLLPAEFSGSLLAQPPKGARMSFIENSEIKLGIDLNRGGAIVFLSRSGSANLINNFDLGRQVQLSFFSGPVPYEVKGQAPSEHWAHIGWNPIQAGDDFENTSQILEHRNDGKTIYVKCIPMQWPLNQVPGECTFESWLELDGPVVVARGRINNSRPDKSQYKARLQELPAVYANAPYHRVISYTGERPFSQDVVSVIPKSTTDHPWTMWQGTEGWAALLNEKDEGLGLVSPGRIHFTGGFAGKPGAGGTHDNSTGYLASQAQEILDHNIGYEFVYELVAGSLKEIRARAETHRREGLPSWDFSKGRDGWHYRNAFDTGWPIREGLHVRLEKEDPQLISPYTFWNAEDAPVLEIECAFKTKAKTAVVFWQRHGEKVPGSKDFVQFSLIPDGEFHRYRINLSESEGYRGGIVRLRFDPVGKGAEGESIWVRSIRLVGEK